LKAGELDEGTIFAYTATEAAYTHGAEWKNQLLACIEDNIRFVDNYLKKHIPQIKAIIPEASFLVWLDCRELGMSSKKLNDLFVKKAKLALNNGEMFGKEGAGFMRMNIGCSRAILEQALNNLKNSL
jgi:cystathionine beta-lyase